MRNLIIGISAVTLIGGGVIFYLEWKRKKEDFPLIFGSRGQKVKDVQRFLNWAGSYGLDIDGKFDNFTLGAVKEETGKDFISKGYYNDFVVPFITGKVK